jgi:pilus assembly protein Flp/PilA
MEQIIRFTRDDDGAVAVEYALIFVILGIALMASMSSIGVTLTGFFTNVSGRLAGS